MPEVAGDQRDARRSGTFQKRRVVRVRQFPRSLPGGGFNPKYPGANGRQRDVHFNGG